MDKKISFAPYSFSKLNLFLTCPRQFKYKYIDKLPTKEKDKSALKKGTSIHHLIEKYPEPGTMEDANNYLDIFNKFLETKFSNFLKLPSKKEMGIGLDYDLNPCKYSKNALFRGYIDYFTVIDDITDEIIEVDSLDDIPDNYELIEII